MWIVDTCIVLDVFENDPEFGRNSANLLEDLCGEGLCICPVTMVELSPAFQGDLSEQKKFLSLARISFSANWSISDTETAHQAWNDYVNSRRREVTPKRPVADILIGAFASNRTGLVTRNAKDFRTWYPELQIQESGSE
jgi:hypothetical protein